MFKRKGVNIFCSLKLKNIQFLLIILTLNVFFSCTRKISLDIKQYSLINEEGKKLVFYIGKKPNSNLKDKILIYLQGSGSQSVKNNFGDGAEATFLGYDILYIEKYGFNSRDLFCQSYTLKSRVENVLNIVKHVKNNIYKNKIKEIGILGQSEGGAIAAEIATNLPMVTHVIIMGAGGLPQAKEFEILLEKNLKKGKPFFKSDIKTKEQLLCKYEEIKKNCSSEKFWLGHTYKYWNTSLRYSAEKYISQLKMPTLFIIGEKDNMVPVESIECLIPKLANRKNFTFKVIPKVNHKFIDSKGKKKSKKVIEIILNWFKQTVDIKS